MYLVSIQGSLAVNDLTPQQIRLPTQSPTTSMSPSHPESSCSTDDGGQAEAGGSSKASKRDGVEEDKCIICLNNLPDVGRGVVSCVSLEN